ncbi:hypothetical protein [Hoeflea sp.]|uniref:hypothetical protein n=1 Tax=Hoeflea sp. TaxID=1940281 RepID=UPI003B028710
MPDDFIQSLLLEHTQVESLDWPSDNVVWITRKGHPPFQAAILKLHLVSAEHVEPFLNGPVSVVANFPKVGKWTGPAIDKCEANGKAWGQWKILLRAINSESPETTENPEIAFSRRALRQHSRVQGVSFEFDHLLLVHHENGKALRVALLYEYDLTGDDVRCARDNLGEFDVLLKTNPNGSILSEAHEVAEALGAKVFGIRDTLGYLTRGDF